MWFVDRLSVQHHQTTSPTRQSFGAAAVLRRAPAIWGPATDVADNSEATRVTPRFIHKADCNAPSGVLVQVCQRGGNRLISSPASRGKLTLTRRSCKPHSVSLIPVSSVSLLTHPAPQAGLPVPPLCHVRVGVPRRFRSPKIAASHPAANCS